MQKEKDSRGNSSMQEIDYINGGSPSTNYTKNRTKSTKKTGYHKGSYHDVSAGGFDSQNKAKKSFDVFAIEEGKSSQESMFRERGA